MKVRVIDENGATGVIRNDLESESAEISEEVRRFLRRTKRSRDTPVTLDSLGPGFLIDLYVGTSVRKVEPVSEAGEEPTGIHWDRIRPRYIPPTGDDTGSGGGCVSYGDSPTPGCSTRSPNAGAE